MHLWELKKQVILYTIKMIKNETTSLHIAILLTGIGAVNIR